MISRPLARRAPRATQCLWRQTSIPRRFNRDIPIQAKRTLIHARGYQSTPVGQESPKPRPTIRAILRHTYKQSPFQFSLAVSIIAVVIVGIAYTSYIYVVYIVNGYKAYPEPVAQKLRRAVYYHQHRPDPKEALRYYQEALVLAKQHGMDRYSDEIIGLKIQVAKFLEEYYHYDLAIQVLEDLKMDNIKFLETQGDQHVADGRRTKILAKTIAMSVKLGELYAHPQVDDQEAAEEALVWAFESIMREKLRREKEGVEEGEGEWLTDEEIGGTAEALAHVYEESNRHFLATPLFLQALIHCPKRSCHAVVLMNNLSTSLAQQRPPDPKAAKPAELRLQARQWSEKALKLAASIAPPDRTEECDLGCAVAAHNLGELAEMDSDIEEARRRYNEAASLAKVLRFEEGVENAQAGLKRITERQRTTGGR